ncbi:MAG: type VI secretion system-associated FHA domain protein TagH [Pararhodobacter sp.]
MSAPLLDLRILNVNALPDGGPLRMVVRPGEILEAGRDSLGWNLPDQSCWISGQHFEMRFENGAWMLSDPSRNGTFVNGAQSRVRSPYRVQAGDRLQVGQYLIAVDFAAAQAADPVSQPPVADPYPTFQDTARPLPGGAPLASGKSGIWSLGTSPAKAETGPRPETFNAPVQDWPEPPARGPMKGPLTEPMSGPLTGPLTGPLPGSGAGFAPDPGFSPHRPLQPGPPQLGTPQSETYSNGIDTGAARPVGAEARALLDVMAEAAGLPPGTFSRHGDPVATAAEIGRALRVVAEDMAGLLKVRAVSRRATRSVQLTMIGHDHNNPLKFMPSPEETLSAMFGPPRPGYLRGTAALQSGFADLKRHQYATQAAIPKALERLLEDLSPEAVERRLGGSGLFSRKARAWETYVERWDAKVQAHDNGLLDVFMAHFADVYDQQDRS